MTNKKFDMVNFMIGFEGGYISEAEIVEGFQHLINDNIVWKLQGFYSRTAEVLIDQGFCKHANEWTPEQARKHFEEYA